MNGRSWTEAPDVVALLRRRWDSGRYLQAHARREPWEPVVVPVRGPNAGDLLDRFEEVRTWADRFSTDVGADVDIEYRRVGGRHIGANQVPARVRIATFERLCSLLDTGTEVSALDELLAHTRRRAPELTEWAEGHPLIVLEHQPVWDRVLATVEWIAAHDTREMFVRQIDVDGVDTKFVERHHKLLGALLVHALPSDRVDPTAGTDFARRFGFAAKPFYVRLRLLDPAVSPFPPSVTELSLRLDELARMDLDVETVFMVENEVTYLAFPALPRAITVFGSGFACSGLAGLDWLERADVVYWGDIDTHGFDILNRLRGYLPGAWLILMDHETLRSHQVHWSVEDRPTRRPLPRLTDAERSLYQELATDVYGAGARLEQERVRFSALRAALAPWARTHPPGAAHGTDGAAG